MYVPVSVFALKNENVKMRSENESAVSGDVSGGKKPAYRYSNSARLPS
jgi:hypothetical protein